MEERTLPALGKKEVRVRIESALTCGTDLKVFKRGYHAKMIRPPSPFGHELAGAIQAGDFIDGQCPLSELPALFHSMIKGNRAIKVEVLPH